MNYTINELTNQAYETEKERLLVNHIIRTEFVVCEEMHKIYHLVELLPSFLKIANLVATMEDQGINPDDDNLVELVSMLNDFESQYFPIELLKQVDNCRDHILGELI